MNTKTNNLFKTFKITACVQVCAAILFTLFSVSFHADISLLAFPLCLVYTGIYVYFTIIKIVKETNGKYFITVEKLNSYLPYLFLVAFIIRRAGDNGTSFAYDLITVFLWVIVFVTTIILTRTQNEKKADALTENWAVKPSFKKPKGKFRVIWEIFDWLDAIVWALFTVMLVQIFIFQLYTIPSESMVPTFLIKDKVAVSKFDCGPKFPLTDIGLPDFRKYKRGDTIVLRNPHYTIDRKSEVKSVTSQLIYMLTLMQVNINRDEDGQPKADPLVKRICGLPGEQLVMQDGVLYTRTASSDEWTPSQMDEKYASWNLNTLNQNIKSKVQRIPLSQDDYQTLLSFEEERRKYDLPAAKVQAQLLTDKMKTFVSANDKSSLFTPPSLLMYEFFDLNNIQDLTRRIMTQKGGIEWFEEFVNSAFDNLNSSKDIYTESNYKLNAMAKICFANLSCRYAQLIRDNVSATNWASDSILSENIKLAQKLVWYVQMILDSRNMPVFPACDSNGNPQYIPSDSYFMMGDNRFNSLDLRHSNDYFLKTLTGQDSNSFTYMSIMNPQYINKKYVIGKPVFRFWPASRMARIR